MNCPVTVQTYITRHYFAYSSTMLPLPSPHADAGYYVLLHATATPAQAARESRDVCQYVTICRLMSVFASAAPLRFFERAYALRLHYADDLDFTAYMPPRCMPLAALAELAAPFSRR